MALQPLSEAGVPFTVPVTVNHANTSLFVLPEGSFYCVETLLLDAVTGVPLRPLVDYMFFQQVPDIAKTTAKEVAAIIQIRNTDITNVVVQGYYTHGVTSEQLNQWNTFTTLYKDVPKWMNWLGCLDDTLQVHPNVKRMVTDPSMEKRTLSDVEIEMGYIADQYMNGDSLYTSHIEYWQQELFNYAKRKYEQSSTDLIAYLKKMQTDVESKVGDFKFTDGDGLMWSGGIQNEYHGVLLMDRGTRPLGSYTYLPQGSAIPSRRTRLFNRVLNEQKITGVLSTNKTSYYQTDILNITLSITELTNRVYPDAHVQVVDPENGKLVAEFLISDIKNGVYNFQVNLQTSAELDGFNKIFVVRATEFLWVEPVLITVIPSGDPTIGRIEAEMLGYNNVGVVTGGGYVNEIRIKFRRRGIIDGAIRLYVRVTGDYPDGTLNPEYQPLQVIDFPADFDERDIVVAKFNPKGSEVETYRTIVTVSTSEDPVNLTAIINSNVWYITGVPINPYINWYFATNASLASTRVSTAEEGNDVYVVGDLSVDRDQFTNIPQLTITSSGLGSAVEGVDFILDNTIIDLGSDRIAYKIQLPFKPESETKYKHLSVKTINSNAAELWIVDKIADSPVTASWHLSPVLTSPVADWVNEKSTFYLHIYAPDVEDGTVLNVSLATPEYYRPYLTIPGSTTVFRGICVVEIVLDAPLVANPINYIKMLIVGPNINYTTVGLAVADTAIPYYEMRYLVDGLEYALTAYPGQNIQCQVRCIKDASASGLATVMLTGTAFTSGPDSDLIFPNGVTDLLATRIVNSTEWTNLFVNGCSIKTPMRLDHLTILTNIVFPTDASGLKLGKDTAALLNLRPSL